MEREERIWFGVLVAIFIVFNVVTLSPIVPWQKWLLWSDQAPDQQVSVAFKDDEIRLPSETVEVKAGELVEFVATSRDVTYGFGVFRQDSTMIFQMQVVPGYKNKITWKFKEPGLYNVRSTEYSGPEHPKMFVENAIKVVP
jgi:cytochrome c oxidase subunit II